MDRDNETVTVRVRHNSIYELQSLINIQFDSTLAGDKQALVQETTDHDHNMHQSLF